MRIVTDARILLTPLAIVLVAAFASAEELPEAATERPEMAAAQRDRLNLDPTLVTGNQELPKVLYIVPWKDADAGDLAGKPVNSLLDEVLAPVDREIFQRQLRYFDQLHTASSDVQAESASGE